MDRKWSPKYLSQFVFKRPTLRFSVVISQRKQYLNPVSSPSLSPLFAFGECSSGDLELLRDFLPVGSFSSSIHRRILSVPQTEQSVVMGRKSKESLTLTLARYAFLCRPSRELRRREPTALLTIW